MELETLQGTVASRHKAQMVPEEAASGIIREAGEYFHHVASWRYDDAPYNEGEAIVELSDVLHYVLEACRDHGITLEELARVNLLKLAARDKGEGRAFTLVMRGYNKAQLPLYEVLDDFEAAIAVVSR